MRYLNRALLALGASIIATDLACAQGGAVGTSQDSVVACENAARIVASGQPRHKQTSALGRLSICGLIGSDAMATAVDSSRNEQDRAVLSRFYSEVDRWRDAHIMSSAISIAQDATASGPARVYAIRHLIRLVQPGSEFTFDSLTSGEIVTETPDLTIITPACRQGLSSFHAISGGTPLPADYETTVKGILTQLAGDATAPAQVRNAAFCGRR